MSGYIIPNIIIIVSLAGILAIFARRFSEAKEKLQEEIGQTKTVSRWNWIRQGWARKLVRFLLESKGLYHPAGVSLRVRQLVSRQEDKQAVVVKPRKSNTSTAKKAFKSPVVKISAPKRLQETSLGSHAIGQTKTHAGDEHAEKVEQVNTAESQIKPELQNLQQKTDRTESLQKNLKIAKKLLDEKQYARARRILQDIAPQLMEDSATWARLGFANFQIGDFAGAVHAYEYSVALDPKHPSRFYNLSLAYLGMGDRVSALKNIDKALVIEDSEKYRNAKQQIIKEASN